MTNQNVTMPCFQVRESQASIKWEGILNIGHISKLLIYDLSVPISLPPRAQCAQYGPSIANSRPFPTQRKRNSHGRRLRRQASLFCSPPPPSSSASATHPPPQFPFLFSFPSLLLLLGRLCDVILFPIFLFLPFCSFLNPFPLSAVARRPQTSTTILYRKMQGMYPGAGWCLFSRRYDPPYNEEKGRQGTNVK